MENRILGRIEVWEIWDKPSKSQIFYSPNYKEDILQIKTDLSLALKKISADFSVQSHFGKIWQRNIINNLKQISHITCSFAGHLKIPLISYHPHPQSVLNH